jgi:sec-independent protein translocase protein TatA
MNLFVLAGVIGPEQLLIIVLLALIFFGGKKIPEMMKGIGQGIKEFKNASKDDADKKSNLPENPSK